MYPSWNWIWKFKLARKCRFKRNVKQRIYRENFVPIRRSSYILRVNIFFLIYRTFVTTEYAIVIVSLRDFTKRILSIVKYKYLTCHLRIQLLVLFYSHDFPYETTTRGNVKILQRYSLLIRKRAKKINISEWNPNRLILDVFAWEFQHWITLSLSHNHHQLADKGIQCNAPHIIPTVLFFVDNSPRRGYKVVQSRGNNIVFQFSRNIIAQTRR